MSRHAATCGANLRGLIAIAQGDGDVRRLRRLRRAADDLAEQARMVGWPALAASFAADGVRVDALLRQLAPAPPGGGTVPPPAGGRA